MASHSTDFLIRASHSRPASEKYIRRLNHSIKALQLLKLLTALQTALS